MLIELNQHIQFTCNAIMVSFVDLFNDSNITNHLLLPHVNYEQLAELLFVNCEGFPKI